MKILVDNPFPESLKKISYNESIVLISNLFISLIILNLGFIENTEIGAFCMLTILIISHLFLEKNSNKIMTITIMSYMVIFILILCTIFNSNIFSVFNISSLKIIVMSAVAFSSSYIIYNNKLKLIYVEWIGFIIILLCNLAFIIADYSPIDIYDNTRHTRNSFLMFDKITGDDANKFASTLFYFDFYPHLCYLICQPFIMLFGKNIDACALPNVFFWLPVGYIYLVRILKNFFHTTGIAISIIGMMIFANQFVMHILKTSLLDFPALCMSFPIIYYFLKSDALKRKKYSLLLGTFIGLGLLIKATFFIIGFGFIGYAIIIYIYQLIKKKNISVIEIKILTENILLYTICVFLIGGIYYWINYEHFNFQLHEVTTEFGKREGDPYPFSFKSAIFYINVFIDYYASNGSKIILFLSFIIYAFFFKKQLSHNISLMFVFIIFYLASTTTWNKDPRTFFPGIALLLPFFTGMNQIKEENIKKSLLLFSYMIAFITTINSISNNAFSFPLTKVNEVRAYAPITPDYVNKTEAYYVTKHMHHYIFNEDMSQPLSIQAETTNFTDDYYRSKFKNIFNQFRKDSIENYSNIFYLKDKTYNDYYMIGLIKNNDSLLQARLIGHWATVNGDIIISVNKTDSLTGNVTEINKINLPTDGRLINIEKPSLTKDMSLSYKIYHSWPSAQLYNCYYKLMKKKDFDSNDFLILNMGINNNIIYLDSLMKINTANHISPQ